MEPSIANVQPAPLSTAGHRYGVTTQTLRRWAAEGRIKTYGFTPRTLRVDLNELDRLFLSGGAA